jgi:two-component system, OmpR family, response regulator
MMPGMDGWEFRRRQQQDPALASIPVVVLSAIAESAQGAETLDAVAETAQDDEGLGDVGFLQKPVAPDVLGVAVERFARARRPEVLIVEDDVAVLRLVERALRHHGFDPVPAPGGAEALALCRGRAQAIDLALIDVQMPGMDGPQTLAALRQLNPRLQAVFMSGHTGKYSAEDLFATGAARVVQKPFPLAEVAQTLWALVAARANG